MQHTQSASSIVTDTKSPALQFSATPSTNQPAWDPPGIALGSSRFGRSLTVCTGGERHWLRSLEGLKNGNSSPLSPVGFKYWADWRCHPPPWSLYSKGGGAHTEQFLTLHVAPSSVCAQPPRAQKGQGVWRGGQTAREHLRGLLENSCLPWPSFLYTKAPARLLRNRAHGLQGCYDLAGVLLCELGHFNWLQWTSSFMSDGRRTVSTHRASGRPGGERRRMKPTRAKHMVRVQTFVTMGFIFRSISRK